jgi:hypothetical protein
MAESTIVKDCRGIGRMVVICKVGIIDYLVSYWCGGSRDGGGKGKGRRGSEGKEKKREKKKRAGKIGGEKSK